MKSYDGFHLQKLIHICCCLHLHEQRLLLPFCTTQVSHNTGSSLEGGRVTRMSVEVREQAQGKEKLRDYRFGQANTVETRDPAYSSC